MPCSRQTRSKMWAPSHRRVGPFLFLGRSAKAMPLSVRTVWIAYGKAAITSRRKAAPFIWVAASKKATWVNLLTRSMARNMWSLPSARRSSQWSMHVADPGLGEAPALRGVRVVLGQPRDAVAHEAAVERTAGQRGNALAQAAEHVIQGQQGAAPELDDDGLLDFGQHGAARPVGPHRLVSGR